MTYTNYKDCYDEQMKELDELLFYKIKYHPDVIKESIHVALENERVVGVAFLQKRSSYLAINTQDLKYHELIIEYALDEQFRDQNNVLMKLMTCLKEDCDHIADEHSGKRIFIKTWAMEEEHVLIEQFLNWGFIIGRGTPIMVRDITSCPKIDMSVPQEYNVEMDGHSETITIKMLKMDEQLMDSYAKANGNAFVATDSIADIWFKLNAPDVKIFAAMQGDRVIASTMIWNINEKRSATENIFCLDTYRRKGITSRLLDYVASYLQQQGFTEASLTVYQDNTPAIRLYEKMGYRYEKFMIGLQYEKDYKALPY